MCSVQLKYIATFHSKVTLVENIDVIDIYNEAYKHAISAIIGGLIIAGIVAKYQITGLSIFLLFQLEFSLW